jgi:hypothetical protein
MKYYLHDSNAFNDEKITELFINFGYEGLGLFYTVLEKLAQQEKPIKTEVLKHQLKVGKKLEKCWKFMETLDILSSNNGETFNKQLLNFSEKYKIKSEKNAKRISDWRNKQEVTENVTCSEQPCNSAKVKESKVNRSKVNRIEEIENENGVLILKTEESFQVEIYPTFNDFWDLYDKKTGRDCCEKKWNKLTQKEKERIMDFIPKYKLSTPDKQFRKNPETFFNNKSWNDEITNNGQATKNGQQGFDIEAVFSIFDATSNQSKTTG